ncbi:MAG: AP2 domain-containing protein [Candidatus Saccharibacteria bacterium]|nr:AP2 domain-containing protein [Candidatus Saccharibacteria bacterium]
MAKRKDWKGEKLYRLTFRSFSHKSKTGRSYWLCLCDCGGNTIVDASNVRRGHIKSCGCLSREIRITHGMTGTPTYNGWSSMIQRCTNPDNPAYYRYGGRGIAVCSKWMRFEGFLDDMGERPENDLSLDRIDVDGDYCKKNCRWATAEEQARNIRARNHVTGVNGVQWYKPTNKYLARIRANKREICLGYFKDFFEAVCARKSAENQLWV